MKYRINHPTLVVPFRILVIATTLFVVAISFFGCSTPKAIGPSGVTTWAYAPDSMSIHPLSRFANNNMVIVHLSMLDGDGFACRGIGSLEIHLTNPSGLLVKKVTHQLDDPELNRTLFDKVTRTYRIPIELPSTEMAYPKLTAKANFNQSHRNSIKSTSYLIEKE